MYTRTAKSLAGITGPLKRGDLISFRHGGQRVHLQVAAVTEPAVKAESLSDADIARLLGENTAEANSDFQGNSSVM